MEEAVAGACAHARSDTLHTAARTNADRKDARWMFMMTFVAMRMRTPTELSLKVDIIVGRHVHVHRQLAETENPAVVTRRDRVL